jgi:hypothetical protein
MKFARSLVSCFVAITIWCCLAVAQQAATAGAPAIVPQLVNYSGKAVDASGKAVSGVAGITFSIYKEQNGGAPLWVETQNITADAKGNYAVQLGATKSDGLPLELFASGEARWLGVRVNGGEEQPRVLLLSVPYALKAADAQTLGGLPASAFMLAGSVSGAGPTPIGKSADEPGALPPTTTNVTTTGGTADYLPFFNGTSSVIDSAMFQSGTGSTAKIGINTATPASTLDVKGGETVRGILNLPVTGTATASAGKASQPLTLTASVYNSTVGSAVNQNFRWQAEPASNNSAGASATLNLLHGAGSNAPTETGLKIGSNGRITFASGQTFPGTGAVTSVDTGLGLTGGPISGSGTLAIDTKVVPQLNAANTFVGTQNVLGQLSATSLTTGAISAISSNPYETIYGGNSSTVSYSAGIVGATFASTGTTFGVYGQSRDGSVGAGVYGQNGTQTSGTAGSVLSHPGVWGDGGSAASWGVLGTTDENNAGAFYNNGSHYTISAVNASGGPFYGLSTSTSEGCWIDYLGNINCTGSKNAVVPIRGGERKVALAAIESPKNWFEDFGSENLTHGAAIVKLEGDFAETVNTEVEYHVFLTPKGDCKGLYVSNEGPGSFEVHELGGGSSSVRFDYRIVALRKNFENIRLADHSHDMDGMSETLRPKEFKSEFKGTNPSSAAVRPPIAPLTK